LAERLHWRAQSSLRQGADCSLLILRPLERALPTEPHGEDNRPAGTADPLPALAERIRPYVRHTDTIEVDERNAVAVVLHAANRAGARAAFKRLCDLLTAPALSGDPTFALTIGYATDTAEYDDERSIADTIRDAWKPRVLLSVALSAIRETDTPGTDEAVPTPRSLARSQQSAALLPTDTPARSTRRPHLRLLASDSPAELVDEGLRERAQTLGVPFVQLPSRLPANCRRAIAPELARELTAVPIGRSRSMLTVAMHNPRDAAAVLRLRSATGLAIFPVLAATDELERALRQIARA
jgi:hypothetical protein